MDKGLLFKLACVWLAGTLLALASFACGGEDRSTPVLPASWQTPPNIPATIEDAKNELESLLKPEDVTAKCWSELKAAFLAELERQCEPDVKFSARAPVGSVNRVRWIYAQAENLSSPSYGYRVSVMWQYKNSGDFNLDGTVSVTDISVLARNLEHSISEFPKLKRLDTNGNNKVDIGDLTAVATHLGTNCAEYCVYGSDDQFGPWTELRCLNYGGYGPTSATPTVGISVNFEHPLDMYYYRVRPVSSDGELGEWSLITKVSWASHVVDLRTHLPGEQLRPSIDLEEPYTFAIWEFGAVCATAHETNNRAVIAFAEPGIHRFFAIYYNGSYTTRIDYKVRMVTPIEEPVKCEFLPTHQGPLLYWSRANIEDVVEKVEVFRDGSLLKEIDGDSFFYLDYTAGTSNRVYEVRGMAGNLIVYSSGVFMAHGSLYDEEHLFLLAEPKEIATEGYSEVIAVIVNNTHELWLIPSLRLHILEGEPDRGGAALCSRNLASEKSAAAEHWPPHMFYPLLASWLVDDHPYDYYDITGYPYIDGERKLQRLDWAESDTPPPGTVPPGRTIVLSTGIYITDDSSITLEPYLNTGKAFSFYIDSERNMHSFECCHSLSIPSCEIGPAQVSVPVTQKLSLGKPPLPGDFDRNGRVELVDMTAFAMGFNRPLTEENTHLDQNDDGEITIIDFQYMWWYYGDTLEDW